MKNVLKKFQQKLVSCVLRNKLDSYKEWKFIRQSMINCLSWSWLMYWRQKLTGPTWCSSRSSISKMKVLDFFSRPPVPLRFTQILPPRGVKISLILKLASCIQKMPHFRIQIIIVIEAQTESFHDNWIYLHKWTEVITNFASNWRKHML